MCKVLIKKLEEAICCEGDFCSSNPIGSYLYYLYSIPKAVSRTVEKAKEFKCPDEVRDGLKMFEEAVVNGEDLLPWLSTQYTERQGNEKDYMMSLFHVCHFHLGTEMEKRRKYGNKIKRTNYILYAYVTENSVYELGIEPHGAWGDVRWQERIIKNWPSLISDSHKLNDCKDVAFCPQNAEEILQLAKLGVNVSFKIGTEQMLPFGGGVTNLGKAQLSQFRSIIIKNWLRKQERAIIKQFGEPVLNGCSVSINKGMLYISSSHFDSIEYIF